MRVLVVSAAALMVALPAGAMAQSTNTPSPGSSTGSAAGSTAASPSGGVPMDQNSAGSVGSRFHSMDAASQDKLRASLEKAGFTNIRVLDSAYLVQARGANGEMVTMMIDTGGSGAAMSGSSGTTPGTMMQGGMMPGNMMPGNAMQGGMMQGGTGSSGTSGNAPSTGTTTGTGPGGSTGTSTGTTTTK